MTRNDQREIVNMAIFGRRRRQNGGSAADAPRTPPPSAPVEEEAYALLPGDDAFPMHVFDSWGIDPLVHTDLIGGGIRVVEKRPIDGPITLMTSGAPRLPTDSGERVELGVEVADGQQDAGRIALGIVCDDMARQRRVPPLESPWRNTNPFLSERPVDSHCMKTPTATSSKTPTAIRRKANAAIHRGEEMPTMHVGDDVSEVAVPE